MGHHSWLMPYKGLYSSPDPSLHLNRLNFSTSKDSFLEELGWVWDEVGVRNSIILLQSCNSILWLQLTRLKNIALVAMSW